MWKCSRCGETVDAELDVCWSCGTSKEGVHDPNFFKGELEPAPENLPMPEVPAGVGDENQEPLVTVAQCNLSAEAHAIRVHLEASGIPVFLADELTIAMDWLLSNAIGGVKVQVPESYQEKALTIIAEIEQKRVERGDDEDEA